jgi:hypothetical protein
MLAKQRPGERPPSTRSGPARPTGPRCSAPPATGPRCCSASPTSCPPTRPTRSVALWRPAGDSKVPPRFETSSPLTARRSSPQDLAELGGDGLRPGHGGPVAGPAKPRPTAPTPRRALRNPHRREPTGPTGQPGSHVRRSTVSRIALLGGSSDGSHRNGGHDDEPGERHRESAAMGRVAGPARSGDSSCRPRV